jgi:outer membrane protein assembly factor BamA
VTCFVLWAYPSEACTTVSYELSGFENTRDSWVRDYLELETLKDPTPEDLMALRKKLMTVDIFTAVSVTQKANQDSTCTVVIEVQEKVTTIPVFRGEYGGGTPLVVLGGYNMNSFGRLLATGGEIRRYGNMAPGAFIFFKSLRAWRGNGLWGAELWLDRRSRPFFDADSRLYGHANSEAWTAKFRWLRPISDRWRAGFQAQAYRERPTTFHLDTSYAGAAKSAPVDLSFNSKSGVGGVLGPLFSYDSLASEGLNQNGVKFTLAVGASKGPETSGGSSDGELFAYALLAADINLASRIYAARSNENTVGAVYYLGGFDSIRGIPDGIHYGNRAIIGNFEARMLAARFKYAHLQPAIFLDTGTVWMNANDPSKNRETALGAGLRISVPQVFRLVFRIDYGRSIGRTKSSGLSIGINQFFQPQRLVF